MANTTLKRVAICAFIMLAVVPMTAEAAITSVTVVTSGPYEKAAGYTYAEITFQGSLTRADGSLGRYSVPAILISPKYTYISIQWNKEILRDAARLLKDPGVYPGSNKPGRVTTVVSSGYSQGGGAQLEFLAEELDPTRVYDGHLIQMIGLACWKREDGSAMMSCSAVTRRAGST